MHGHPQLPLPGNVDKCDGMLPAELDLSGEVCNCLLHLPTPGRDPASPTQVKRFGLELRSKPGALVTFQIKVALVIM
jgi:hypothetical protein